MVLTNYYNTLKNKFVTGDNKKLAANFFYLSVLQIVSYAVPLLTLPYLFKVLGADKFGLVMFAQAFVTYFIMLIDYGFNLSATRETSIHRNDKTKISEIYSSIIIIKILLTAFSFLIFILIVFNTKNFNSNRFVYLSSFSLVIGQLFFSIWFFQGIEKMQQITFISSISRIITTILIFVLIRTSSDYIYVSLLYAVGYLISGAMSVYIIGNRYKIKFYLPTHSVILKQLKEGWVFFIASISVNLYRNTNVFILGIVSNNIYVGYYSIAEKTIKAAQSLLDPIAQTLYPYVAKKYTALNIRDSIKNVFFISKLYLAVLTIIIIILFSISKYIVLFLSGSFNKSIVCDLRILTLVLLFGSLNSILGVIGLINLGQKDFFAKSVGIIGVLNVIICVVLGKMFHDVGASISIALAEILLAFLFVYKLMAIHKNANLTHG